MINLRRRATKLIQQHNPDSSSYLEDRRTGIESYTDEGSIERAVQFAQEYALGIVKDIIKGPDAIGVALHWDDKLRRALNKK